ncbi:MAG: slipin family protein, partial [Gammaproteobacteria bacterium]|nr:slipin family protein [Gammaproteobacteria bacterium]
MGFLTTSSFILIVIVMLVFSAFRILREYERGVVFML